MKNCDRRRQSVLNMLRKTKKLTVEEAMQAFGVSESTVRRLFAQLEAEGEVIRAYGGICFTGLSDGARSYMFDLVQLENADEKNAIGKAAMQLIRNGDIIYLDSGTTVMSLGAAMAEVFRDAAAVGASAETAAEARLLSLMRIVLYVVVRDHCLVRYGENLRDGGDNFYSRVVKRRTCLAAEPRIGHDAVHLGKRSIAHNGGASVF